MYYNKSIQSMLCIFLFLFILFSYFPSFGFDEEKQEINEILSELQKNETTKEVSNQDDNLQLNSRSCIVLDRNTKQTLYSKNEKNRVKMASTTKIMTALVVLENSSLDKTVEASKKAAGTGGSRLGLKTNDKITIRDLLYGLLLCSGNDAAVCLAESIAGSVPEFCNIMNQKAQDLGLTNTHFESPHGLDSDQHYTTAYELALLADYAMQNPTFKNIVGTKTQTINLNGYPKTLTNTNELLGNLDGIYGIKTGFTNGANRCLVTACKRGNMDIICVVLGADTKKFRTQDSIKLIEFTFKNYEYFNLQDFAEQYVTNWKNENPNYFTIEKGNSNQLDFKIDSKLQDYKTIAIKKSLKDNIEASITLSTYFNAPVETDQVIGELKIFSNETELMHLNVLSNSTINKKNTIDYLLFFFKSYPNQLQQIFS